MMSKARSVRAYNLNMSFDASPTLDTTGVFLDMSNAFRKVWREV